MNFTGLSGLQLSPMHIIVKPGILVEYISSVSWPKTPKSLTMTEFSGTSITLFIGWRVVEVCSRIDYSTSFPCFTTYLAFSHSMHILSFFRPNQYEIIKNQLENKMEVYDIWQKGNLSEI